MGRKNPDRVSIQDMYRSGKTVVHMIQQRWEVISIFQECRLQMLVRLDWIARISGPDTSLWNRRAKCRRLLCKGVTTFHAKAPGMTVYGDLTINERAP